MKKHFRVTIPWQTLAGIGIYTAVGIGAGIINGLLGTGGGILLLSVLRRRCNSRDAFASALACILPLSALSVILYCMRGSLTWEMMTSDALPYLLGAIPGGILGACLLDRIKPSVLQYLFAVLLLFSGWRMAFS